MKPRAILLAVISIASLMFMGPAISEAQVRIDVTTSSGDVARAARQFAVHTAQLHQALQVTEGRSMLTRQARELASEARQLADMTRRFGRHRHIRGELSQVQRDFAQLRADLFEANRIRNLDRAAIAWSRVAASHERLSLAARVPADQLCAVSNYTPSRGSSYFE